MGITLRIVRRLVASSFGLGRLPGVLWGSDAGAGTFGAALGGGIGAALLTGPWWAGLLAAAVAVMVSLWASQPFAEGDPGWVCIDETAGTLVALVGLSGWPWLLALIVARTADIFKVLPGVRAAERLPGAPGITGDDLVAGLYGLALGWAATGLGL